MSRGLNQVRTQATNFQTIAGWVVRVLRLDFTALDEVRSEPQATMASIMVVLGSSIMCGIGTWLWAIQHDDFGAIDTNEVLLKALLAGSIIQTAVWFLWVYVVYQVLTRGYNARAEFAELVRTMGFSFAPASLGIFVGLTMLAVPLGVLSMAIAFLMGNIAVQSASDAEPREATIANIAGFATFAIVMGVFANVAEVGTFGGLAPGIFFFSLDL